MPVLPTDVTPCCVCTTNGLEGEITAARSLGSFQEHNPLHSPDNSAFSSSTNTSGGPKSRVVDARGDSTTSLSPFGGLDESCLDPRLLSEALQQPLTPFEARSSFYTLPDGSMATDPIIDPLENLEIGNANYTSVPSASGDLGSMMKSRLLEFNKDLRSHPSLVVGSNGMSLDTSMLMDHSKQPLRSPQAKSPFDMSLEELMAIDPRADSLENREFEDSILAGLDLENIEGLNLAFASDASNSRVTDGHGFSDLDFSIDEDPEQAANALKTTITLDGAEPSIVSSIMNILIHSKARIRFETQDPQR